MINSFVSANGLTLNQSSKKQAPLYNSWREKEKENKEEELL